MSEQHLILVPRLSEKATALAQSRQYIFKVPITTNKIEVRRALEKQYGVKVASVNMIRMDGKRVSFGRRAGQHSAFKKAMVTLAENSKNLEIGQAA
jgi:large subunit ribosomal protein L23